MAGRARRAAVQDAPARSGRATSGATAAPRGSDEPTLDQLFAEPIVRQLMHRDGIDEQTTRRLCRRAAVARPAPELRCMLPASRAKDDPNTIVHLLHDTARRWRKLYDREVCARIPGMTCARCAVLIRLAQHEGVNQTALAQDLVVRPITLARLLDRLETAGFIARLPDPHDRRAISWRSRPKHGHRSNAFTAWPGKSVATRSLGSPKPKPTSCARFSAGYGRILRPARVKCRARRPLESRKIIGCANEHILESFSTRNAMDLEFSSTPLVPTSEP